MAFLGLLPPNVIVTCRFTNHLLPNTVSNHNHNQHSQIWTISNVLSMIRLVLILPAAWYLWHGQNITALAVGVTCYVTDLLDGWLARKLNQITELGKILDPLADKLFVGVITTILVIQGRMPSWFVVLVLSRDIIILLAGTYISRRVGYVLPSNYPGKIAVFTIVYTMFCTVADFPPVVVQPGIWISTALLTLSFALYGRRFFQLLRDPNAQ